MKARLVTALAVALSACRREPPVEERRPATLAPPVRAPADHLAPGELVEGREVIVGLKLPLGMRVLVSTMDRGSAEGPIKPELVTNYVRARLTDGKMAVGASSTVFDGAHLPSLPGRDLRVTVASNHGFCRVEVWDVTPPKRPPDPGNDVDRWKAAGLNPDGTPLDPKKLQ